MKEKLSILLVTIVLFAMAIVLSGQRPVMAAADPAVTCPAVAKAGDFVVYMCEPNYGPPFYINSVGFMSLAE